MNVLSFQNYSWTRIFRTSEGNENWVEKYGYFEKSGVTEIAVSDRGEGNDFCFELSGGSKKWGFKKSGFYCSYFSFKETVNSSSYVRFKKILKLLFVEPLKTALFRTTTKKSTTSDKSVEAFQCSFQFCAIQPSCPKGTNSPSPLSTPKGKRSFNLRL